MLGAELGEALVDLLGEFAVGVVGVFEAADESGAACLVVVEFVV